MKPIKPKYSGTVNVQWSITKRSKEIISQYSKYTKYEESELIDKLINEILDDDSFVTWLKTRRYQAKANKFIFNDTSKLENIPDEENEETSIF